MVLKKPFLKKTSKSFTNFLKQDEFIAHFYKENFTKYANIFLKNQQNNKAGISISKYVKKNYKKNHSM